MCMLISHQGRKQVKEDMDESIKDRYKELQSIGGFEDDLNKAT